MSRRPLVVGVKDVDKLEWSAEVWKLSYEDVLLIRRTGMLGAADPAAARGVFGLRRWDLWIAETDAVLRRAV